MYENWKVIKRDGSVESFISDKIRKAILCPFIACYNELKKKRGLDILEYDIEKNWDENMQNVYSKVIRAMEEFDGSLNGRSRGLMAPPNVHVLFRVEDIQDCIENVLHSENYQEVERAFITYREEHKKRRDRYEELMNKVEIKVMASDVKNQNANLDEHSFGGRFGEVAETSLKAFASDNLLSNLSYNEFMNNVIYIHDFGHYALGDHNCLTVPFDKLLKNGFKTRQTRVRGAKSLSSAFQLVAVIFQLQSLCQFGGVSSSHLDWTLEPYVKMSFKKHYMFAIEHFRNGSMSSVYDRLKNSGLLSIQDDIYTGDQQLWNYAMDATQKEALQGAEGLYHNLNTLQSRSGNQLPFTSINYGTCTSPEGRLIIDALLTKLEEGLGPLGSTSIFPCGIFQLKDGVNKHKGEPNYDLFRKALHCTATRIYPNYANCDWSGNAGYDENDPNTYVSTMGCRTANGYDINGFCQLKDGIGNICPVTIILPTVAMMAKEEFDKSDFSKPLIDIFMEILEDKIENARIMLMERFTYIASQPPEAARFMWENGTMEGYIPEEGIVSALKHGTLAIGQIGLSECLKILMGVDHTTPEGMTVAKAIEGLFAEKCKTYKEVYNLNFGVYYTPAENLCYTSMQKFKEKYGVIEGVSDKDYFTNSMHVPVDYNCTVFEKIRIESELTGYSSAGCITYVELDGSIQNNIPALEDIVMFAMDHDIPYFAVNVPNDHCEDCGYRGEFDTCPKCGSSNVARLRRVTGYLTGDYKTAFNPGKQAEVEDRVKHTITKSES